MAEMSQLFTSQYWYSSVIILLLTMAIKFIIGRYVTHQPLAFFQFYCQRLAAKVNRSNNSKHQQYIAGFIAVVITLLPIVIMLALFEVLVAATWLWHGFLLYIALGTLNLSQLTTNIAKALAHNYKYQAKELLAPWVLRETSALSEIGISKASIEMQLLRTVQLIFCVSFYFLFLGPLMAIAFRLLLEMHYAWNVKVQRFRFFGLAVNKMILWLQWLPTRIFSLCFLLSMLGKNMTLCWHLTRGKFFQLSNGLLLHLMALALEIQLSGVAIYEKSKLPKPCYNEQARLVQTTDIIYANRQLNFCLVICLLFVVVLAVCSYLTKV